MNPSFHGSLDPSLERIRDLPVFTVSNGLRPLAYDLRADEALGDDGWLYRRGKRDQRWYVAIADRPHLGLSGDVRLILRRDHLTIPYVEDLRWRYGQYCVRVVRARRERAAEALRGVEDPHFYKGDQRVNLEVRERRADWTNVSEREVAKASDLISRIGQIGLGPGLEAGSSYHATQKWCSARHGKLHVLKRLLGVLFDDLIVRVYGDALLTSEGRMMKVFALVNGRTYLIHNKGTEPLSHWPDPVDQVINVHETKLPDRFFGPHGIVLSEPPKRK